MNHPFNTLEGFDQMNHIFESNRMLMETEAKVVSFLTVVKSVVLAMMLQL